LKDGIVLMKIEDEKIIIGSLKKVDLTKYFDLIELDLQSDISEWKKIKEKFMIFVDACVFVHAFH
jgi:hypothetical protein